MKSQPIRFLIGAAFCALTIFATISSAQTAAGDPMTTGPAPKGDAWTPAWGFWPNVPMAWQQTFQGQVNQVKKGPARVIFLGDSITAGWLKSGKEIWKQRLEPSSPVNLGIGGDTTRQILWRLDHGTLDGAKPGLIVLMIGVNNIFTGTGSDDDIVRGIDEILTQLQLKCPETKILLLGILPLGNDSQSARTKNINVQLEKIQKPSVRFLDMGGKFQNTEGKILTELYNKDGTHLETPGYEMWWQTMQPVFEEMLK